MLTPGWLEAPMLRGLALRRRGALARAASSRLAGAEAHPSCGPTPKRHGSWVKTASARLAWEVPLLRDQGRTRLGNHCGAVSAHLVWAEDLLLRDRALRRRGPRGKAVSARLAVLQACRGAAPPTALVVGTALQAVAASQVVAEATALSQAGLAPQLLDMEEPRQGMEVAVPPDWEEEYLLMLFRRDARHHHHNHSAN